MKVTEEQYFKLGNHTRIKMILKMMSEINLFEFEDGMQSQLADAFNSLQGVHEQLSSEYEITDKPT